MECLKAVPTRALYTGSLTRAAIRHADASGHPWFIVSALWGLMESGQVVAPYNLRVTELGAQQQAVWAERVAEVHAGEAYLGRLRGPLRAQGFTVEAPLAGLAIGERLRWYSDRR